MNRSAIMQAWPITPGLKYIMIVNAALWLLTTIAWRFGSTAVYQEMALTPVLVYPGLHLWQVFTYMWVHALGGYLHLMMNLLFLWMFGGTLEQSWGTRAFLRFYFICGVGAGIVVLVTGLLFAPTIPTVGASGAIYGLVVAWAISFPDRLVYIFGVFPIKGRHFALIPIGFALLDFLVAGSGTSHAAHLGGMAIAALLITGLWRPSRLKNRVRYHWLRRKLKVLDGQNTPPKGKYWN